MNRLRGLVIIAAVGALALGAPGARVEAAPAGSAGACALVSLTLWTDINNDVRIAADPGSTCAEVDNNQLDLHSVGSLFMAGLVSSCTSGTTLNVSADVTFVPAGHAGYPPVSLILTTDPVSGATAVRLTSAGLVLVGAGTAKFGGGGCSAATWSLGEIAYEDPEVS